jgi:hypothetical protein
LFWSDFWGDEYGGDDLEIILNHGGTLSNSANAVIFIQ